MPHAQSLLAEFGNAPLAALQAAESEERPLLQFLLEQLAQGARLDALATADHLQKLSVPAVLSTMHRWIFDLMAARLAGRPRYFPRSAMPCCAARAPSRWSAWSGSRGPCPSGGAPNSTRWPRGSSSKAFCWITGSSFRLPELQRLEPL